MPTPDSTLSTLDKIRIKIRRITRNPSSAQITDAQIDEYVNTFVLYDMPAYLKLESLEQVLTFFTSPHMDTYETNLVDATDPLYNFKNVYTNVIRPAYIAGYKVPLYNSQEEFYDVYPQTNNMVSIGTGNGVNLDFYRTVTDDPILPNKVTVSSISTAGNVLLALDDGDYGFTGDATALSTVAYDTGSVYVGFTVAPAVGETVWLQTVSCAPGKPTSILFFDDKFVLRPVPDEVYRVEVTAYKRPTELLLDADVPELSEWWQYIAVGSGIKILQDRLDNEGVSMLMPMFKEQETLIGRRKIIQNAGKRVATIYSGGL